MRNQAPLSPARVLYEELRENEEAGLLDAWPARGEADNREAAPGDTRGPAANHGDIQRINPDPVTTDKVKQIHAVDEIADGGSTQPRSALAAIIRLQSTEIERLALDNDRLAARLDAVSQLHEDERNQRLDLDRRLYVASLRNETPPPAIDVHEIRRAAREGMSAEIKPVLTAILDLLESTLPRGGEIAKPAAMVEETPVSAPASLVVEVIGDLQRLPEILTRPIEELTSDTGNAGPTPDRVADLPARNLPRESSAMSSAPASALPSVFAWTHLFS